MMPGQPGEPGPVGMVSQSGMNAGEFVRHALPRGIRCSKVISFGNGADLKAADFFDYLADGFVFVGYLPRRSADRLRLLASFSREKRTIVAFEAPHRLRRSLDDLIATFGEGRQAAVCRELTKIYEEILRDNLGGIRDHFNRVEPRGEFTLVIGGSPDGTAWELTEVRAALAARLEGGMSPTQAARSVAAESGWTRHEVYRLAVEGR